MLLRCRPFILVLLALAASVPVFAHEHRITWLNDDLAPAFINVGPYQGKGIVDGVVAMYQEHMAAYEHESVTANMIRILEMMKLGEQVCYAGFIKTPEREEFIYFSKPNLVHISNVLIFKASATESLLQHKQTASLAGLLDQGDLTIGIVQGRSYGHGIDSLLAAVPPDDPRVHLSNWDDMERLLALLDSGRIDCIIGFPWEFSYTIRNRSNKDNYQVAIIDEMAGEQWGLNFVGCPRNEWGRAAIEAINGAIDQFKGTAEHIKHQKRWMPEEIQPELMEVYEREILAR